MLYVPRTHSYSSAPSDRHHPQISTRRYLNFRSCAAQTLRDHAALGLHDVRSAFAVPTPTPDPLPPYSSDTVAANVG